MVKVIFDSIFSYICHSGYDPLVKSFKSVRTLDRNAFEHGAIRRELNLAFTRARIPDILYLSDYDGSPKLGGMLNDPAFWRNSKAAATSRGSYHVQETAHVAHAFLTFSINILTPSQELHQLTSPSRTPTF